MEELSNWIAVRSPGKKPASDSRSAVHLVSQQKPVEERQHCDYRGLPLESDSSSQLVEISAFPHCRFAVVLLSSESKWLWWFQ